MNLDGARVLVVGLGATGLSAARWLARRGARVRVADSRDHPPGLDALRAALPQVPVHTGAFDAARFAQADLIVASPGVAPSTPAIAAAVAAGVPLCGDVELFADALDAVADAHGAARPVRLAITGSNGKSTVTELVGEIARTAGRETLVAGNIGLPVLDALTEIETGERAVPDVVVLELSSFQLETTSAALAADAAVVLNLSEDHLDRHGSMAAYAAAKARIFAGAALQIVNAADAAVVAMPRVGAPVVRFDLTAPASPGDWGLVDAPDGTAWIAHGTKRIAALTALRIAGRHNVANALAAAALADAAGIDAAAIAAGLAGFRGLAHRVEWVADIDGRAFYDDSKGTNVGATVAALGGLGRAAALIAGGDGKGQDFAPLRPVVDAHARAVVLIGRDRERIADALAGTAVPLVRAADLPAAVVAAFDHTHAGDAVLLSPACASFDMFRDYAHRAEVFRGAVAALQEARACSAR
ncbi:MAG: UDP-N-acetylmuramoyl-L-alanine--D-glutamate ligase [Burkholderiales bacterium]|nr:UDP-N-acetylmuramoyl-L-alanine--D-glutamate ligase [Burkholderiales bacterium]